MVKKNQGLTLLNSMVDIAGSSRWVYPAILSGTTHTRRCHVAFCVTVQVALAEEKWELLRTCFRDDLTVSASLF